MSPPCHAAYTIVELEQGTDTWLEWRSQGIGASDAPAIMGENPWKSPERLLQEKCGETRRFVPNAAMMRGVELEPEARRSYEQRLGVSVAPACLQSARFDWLRASVDGLALDGSAVVEIKCGESVYSKSAASRKVPGYYFGQLQHILAVTDLPAIDFWCYLPDRPVVHLNVPRDDAYIARMLDIEAAFWRQITAQRAKG